MFIVLLFETCSVLSFLLTLFVLNLILAIRRCLILFIFMANIDILLNLNPIALRPILR